MKIKLNIENHFFIWEDIISPNHLHQNYTKVSGYKSVANRTQSLKSNQSIFI